MYYQELLNFLLDDEDKRKDFWDNYIDVSKSIELNVFEYHMKRIQENTLTEHDFISLYSYNKKQALEQLFLIPVVNEVELVEEMIRTTNKDISYLYREKKENPKYGVKMIIL